MNFPGYPVVLLSLLWLVPTAGRTADAVSVTRDNLLVCTASDGRSLPVKSPETWETRRKAILQAMQSIMGQLPAANAKCPLDISVETEEDLSTFTRRKLSYQILPGVRVPAYLLIPKSAHVPGTRLPGMITLHQTHPEGQRVVVGLGQSPDDEYGVELVKRGYVCLAPPYPMLANYWPDVHKLGFDSGTLLAIWINIRGLDLLASLPFVQTNGFGSIGHSLGGHNGLYTAAFDPRLVAVVSSCGFDSYRDYYDGDPANWQKERGWCQTRYMPKLAAFQGRLEDLPFDFPEVLAAIAPRAIFVNAPLGDSNFRWKSVDRVVKLANEVYGLFPKAIPIKVEHPDSPHRFPPEVRQQAYAFLDKILNKRP